ncbi:MAG: hypothetical protein EWM47_04700 [Anaerolineaceae bacterium]|nr:MAG: hypothetical protein EWM47_04700 [Anaerolineaceae bacterium]
MFKWDKLLRKNKLPKAIKYMEDETENSEAQLYSDTQMPEGGAASESEEEYEIVEIEIRPAKIICPDCGGITLEGLEFCDKCGGEL